MPFYDMSLLSSRTLELSEHRLRQSLMVNQNSNWKVVSVSIAIHGWQKLEWLTDTLFRAFGTAFDRVRTWSPHAALLWGLGSGVWYSRLSFQSTSSNCWRTESPNTSGSSETYCRLYVQAHEGRLHGREARAAHEESDQSE